MVRRTRTAAKHASGTRNTRGLIGNVGHSRAARGFQIVKFFLLVQSIHLVLQFLDLRQRADSLSRVRPSFAHKVHLSSIAELLLFFFSKQILRNSFKFEATYLRDFLDKVCSSLLVLLIFFGFSLELDKLIGLHDPAPFAVIQVDDWCHIRISSLPTFPVHFDFIFRDCSLSLTFTLKSSPGCSFKVIMKFSFLRQKPFLFLFTISPSFQQGFFV